MSFAGLKEEGGGGRGDFPKPIEILMLRKKKNNDNMSRTTYVKLLYMYFKRLYQMPYMQYS